MRVRITKAPGNATVDGVPLNKFFVDSTYEVPTWLGSYLLAQHWAVPVDSDEPALVLPIDHPAASRLGRRELDHAHDTARPSEKPRRRR